MDKYSETSQRNRRRFREFRVTQERTAARLGLTLPTLKGRKNARAKASPGAIKEIGDPLVGLDDSGRDLQAKYFPEERT